MSYSPTLGTSISNTKLRTPEHISPFSGMCAVCTENCPGTCEIGLSATRGSMAAEISGLDSYRDLMEKELNSI